MERASWSQGVALAAVDRLERPGRRQPGAALASQTHGTPPKSARFRVVFLWCVQNYQGMSDERATPLPGQESVWDYPTVPRLEASRRSVAGEAFGAVLFNVRGGFRVIERGFAPTHYVLIAKTRMELLEDSGRRRRCPHRGLMAFWSLVTAERTLHNIAWTIVDPEPAFEELRDHIAFFPSALGACWLDGERVREVPGDASGGWITSHVAGPFEHGQPPTLTEVSADELPST